MGASTFPVTPTQGRLLPLPILLATLALGACGDTQMAYFSGDDRTQTVSLVREQAWLGGPWQTTLIVANGQKCQRRHPLEGLSASELGIDVYRPEAGVFILDTGKRWYVTELQNCALQAYKKPPPQPGELIGNFQMQDAKSRFVSKSPAKTITGSVNRPQAAVK